jgi:hypothetical protein
MTVQPFRRSGTKSGLACKAIGTLLVVAGLVATNGVGVRAVEAAPASPGTWSAPKTIPGSSAANGPIALAQFQSHLYAAWVGDGNPGPV